MEIVFRPHHFLCTLCFQGRGYSSTFINNFQMIVDTLNLPQGENTLIKVVDHTDSICSSCPNQREKSCVTQDKITRLDRAHANALHIAPGDMLTWADAKKRIAEKITLDRFHKMCAGCNWKSYGICEEILTLFLQENISEKKDEPHDRSQL